MKFHKDNFLDFGISAFSKQNEQFDGTMGSLFWMAPEVLEGFF